MHQPLSLTHGRHSTNVRFPPPCPKPLLAQLLLRLCLGKKRKESWTQTWPTFSAKSLVFESQVYCLWKRGNSRDALSQLAQTWPDVLFWKLPAKEGSWDSFFQLDPGMSPLTSWTLEAFVKTGIPSPFCQSSSFVGGFVVSWTVGLATIISRAPNFHLQRTYRRRWFLVWLLRAHRDRQSPAQRKVWPRSGDTADGGWGSGLTGSVQH